MARLHVVSGSAFVQDEFAVPDRLVADRFVLEPLGPQHSEADYAAWTSSVEHIRATPGWRGTSWPVEMTPQQNTDDLIRHQEDFAARRGFTYTVLDPGDRQVIGCVYLYPPRRPGTDVQVHSWVRADRADLDVPLWQAVTDWLRDQWPWTAPDYAPRP
jgi:RimJ/RimL family protein N-acetyltransferase